MRGFDFVKKLSCLLDHLLTLYERLDMLGGASKLRVNVMHDRNVINESVCEVRCACFSFRDRFSF